MTNQLPDIIGQEAIINRVRMWIHTGSKVNVLFRGAPGSGKTLIARYYASMIGKEFYHYRMCSGESAGPPDDGEPVLLDEIHRLRHEEQWYDYSPLIGCTTEGARISDPLKSRMVELWMAEYSLRELTAIVMDATRLPSVAAYIAASRGRGSPRISNQIGNQIQIALEYNSSLHPTEERIRELCDRMGYMKDGFTVNDLRYLEALSEGRAAASTLAAKLNLPLDTIRTEFEPFLMRKGLVRITSRGRELGIDPTSVRALRQNLVLY
jgi:Holliday junction resolvasome RuvABC ATP-dependent DNA helicase subunit